MKKTKKGFTLIELLVVIAIIGILATALTPKLREQLAKAKDSKAVAILGAGRTAAAVLLIEKSILKTSTDSLIINITTKEIFDRLDSNGKKVYHNGSDPNYVKIGGSRSDTEGKVTYGGIMGLNTPIITDDSIEFKFYGTARVGDTYYGTHSVEGKSWADY